jgi:hypothetical protein
MPASSEDRQRQRIGGIGGCRFGLQPKDSGDHGGGLRLAGAAVAGDRGLDFTGHRRPARVPITVDTFCWENTRSMAMTSGRCVSSQCSTCSLIVSSLFGSVASARVRTTSTSRAMIWRPLQVLHDR